MRNGDVRLLCSLVKAKLLSLDEMLPCNFFLDRAFHIGKGPGGIAVARALHDLIKKAQLVRGVTKELLVETGLGTVRDVAERVGEAFVKLLGEKVRREVAVDEAKEVVGEFRFFIRRAELRGREFMGKKQSIVGRHCFSSLLSFSS
ncbi:MAG: hypothetical protein WCE63_17865 [Acidobacteriaceae bacterium]